MDDILYCDACIIKISYAWYQSFAINSSSPRWHPFYQVILNRALYSSFEFQIMRCLTCAYDAKHHLHHTAHSMIEPPTIERIGSGSSHIPSGAPQHHHDSTNKKTIIKKQRPVQERDDFSTLLTGKFTLLMPLKTNRREDTLSFRPSSFMRWWVMPFALLPLVLTDTLFYLFQSQRHFVSASMLEWSTCK